MRYVTTTGEELDHLREGLAVLESLNEYEEQVVEIYLYGLTDNPTLLEAVKDAVEYWSDETIAAQDVQVTEAVFMFKISSDFLYYITGSGLQLREAEIVYSGGNEGPQSVWLKSKHGVRVAAGQFKTLALSRDEFSGEDFLMQYGQKTQQPAPQEVQRTEPTQEVATQPVEPVTPGREGVAPAKKSSLNFDVDTWLN
jgi:hypothetical protein